jgi:hypothetical protein
MEMYRLRNQPTAKAEGYPLVNPSFIFSFIRKRGLRLLNCRVTLVVFNDDQDPTEIYIVIPVKAGIQAMLRTWIPNQAEGAPQA